MRTTALRTHRLVTGQGRRLRSPLRSLLFFPGASERLFPLPSAGGRVACTGGAPRPGPGPCLAEAGGEGINYSGSSPEEDRRLRGGACTPTLTSTSWVSVVPDPRGPPFTSVSDRLGAGGGQGRGGARRVPSRSPRAGCRRAGHQLPWLEALCGRRPLPFAGAGGGTHLPEKLHPGRGLFLLDGTRPRTQPVPELHLTLAVLGDCRGPWGPVQETPCGVLQAAP